MRPKNMHRPQFVTTFAPSISLAMSLPVQLGPRTWYRHNQRHYIHVDENASDSKRSLEVERPGIENKPTS